LSCRHRSKQNAYTTIALALLFSENVETIERSSSTGLFRVCVDGAGHDLICICDDSFLEIGRSERESIRLKAREKDRVEFERAKKEKDARRRDTTEE
jgi:hypothetical protein